MLRRSFLACLFAALALAVGGCSRKPPQGLATGHLRVVTWNLEWFPGRVPDSTREQQQEHMAAAQRALGELRPDLLLLQEVRDWKAVEELVSVTPGLDVHVVSRFGGRPQNQAIASRLPADSSWSASWKHGPAEPPRGYAFAALLLPGGRFLLCYSLHLKSNLGELRDNIAMRRESSRQLLRHVSEMLAIYGKRGPCAVIVGGDMNTSMDDPKFASDPSLRALRAAGFYWTHESVRFAKRITIPGNAQYPDNCFDHIFTLGLGKPVAFVERYRGVSDHHPVELDIDLNAADFQPKLDLVAGEKALNSAPVAPLPNLSAGVLSANDGAGIRAAVGQVVTVRGKVSRIGETESGSITFIDFSGNGREQFVAIVRRERLDEVSAAYGGNLRGGLLNKTIEVRGKVEFYRNTPEIVLTRADQIRIVKP